MEENMKKLLAGLRDLHVECFSGVSCFNLQNNVLEIGNSVYRTKVWFTEDSVIVGSESYDDGELFQSSTTSSFLLNDTEQILEAAQAQMKELGLN